MNGISNFQQRTNVGQLLFFKLLSQGDAEHAVRDLRAYFVGPLHRFENARRLRSDRVLQQFLESGPLLDPRPLTNFFDDAAGYRLDALDWAQTCYLRATILREISFVDQLLVSHSESERTVKFLALLQLLQIFEGSSYLVDLKDRIGDGNFYRYIGTGDLWDPVFFEFYLQHRLLHDAPQFLTADQFEPAIKGMFNIWEAARLMDEEKIETTVVHLRQIIAKLHALLHDDAFCALWKPSLQIFSQPFGSSSAFLRCLYNLSCGQESLTVRTWNASASLPAPCTPGTT